MNVPMKSIFLVNPISGRGHLDAYARLYSRAFIELGYRVVLVAETDADAPGYLARSAVSQASSFSFVSFAQAMASRTEEPEAIASVASGTGEPSERANMSALLRARLVWQEDGPTGILLRFLTVPRRF